MTAILEILQQNNTWSPPEIPAEEIAYAVRNDDAACQGRAYLHIFRTEPYIDSVYIEYDPDRSPKTIRRFAIHEGYVWDRKSERFFEERCVRAKDCSYPGGKLDQIYSAYREAHPEWHLKRYYTKGLRLLDHIYHCVRQNSAREILYKSGLDELAAHVDELDELNLLAGRPSEIFDGLSMKVLRSVNCPDGAALVNHRQTRAFLKDLNMKFPDLFKEKLNDAQCRYLKFLIDGDLTPGEAGRLFLARKKDLEPIWTYAQFEVFMVEELLRRKKEDLKKSLSAIDPIYMRYIEDHSNPYPDADLRRIEFYLLDKRKEYDRAIRRSNRKRIYEWQERGKDYIVRYPQTINDFCREAAYMSNCLLAYTDAVINNDTTVLFMRRSDDVNMPFITIEVFGDKLMQAYHRFNEDCTLEEADWIRDYCHRHGISPGNFAFNAEVDELF